jgi:hypothetical protein
MGYPMALNLYKKLPTDWTLFICDTNDEVKERFKQEAEGKAHIQVAKHGAHAARYAVSIDCTRVIHGIRAHLLILGHPHQRAPGRGNCPFGLP